MTETGEARTLRRTVALLADLVSSPVDSPHVAALLEVVRDEGDPYVRHRYEPGHVTASAFVLHPGRPAVALVHHAKIGLWVQPGGHVEASDLTVEEGSRREVAEEVGLVGLESHGLLDVDVHAFPARDGAPAHLHFDVRYLFGAGDDAIRPGDGVTEARWVDLADARAMDESVARPARAILDRW